MLMKKFSILALLLLAVPAMVKAEDTKSPLDGFSAGLGVGVLGGLNINVGYRLSSKPDAPNNWKSKIGFRADFNTWAPFGGLLEGIAEDQAKDEIDNRSGTDGTIKVKDDYFALVDKKTINVEAKGNVFGALVDFYPFNHTKRYKGFRVSGGYYFGGLEFNADAEAKVTGKVPADFKWSRPIVVQGVNYTPRIDVTNDAIVEAAIDAHPRLNVRATGPYLGFGWDVGLSSNLKLVFDAGVVFSKVHNNHEATMKDNLDEPGLRIIQASTADWVKELKIDVREALSDSFAQIHPDNWEYAADYMYNMLKDDPGLAGLEVERIGPYIISINTESLLTNTDTGKEQVDSALDDMRKERTDALKRTNNKLKDYSYFPVLKIGVVWRF